MSLTFCSHYFDDAEARAAFQRFLLEIHRLDLSLWEAEGYWDDAYLPFSFFEGDKVIATTCIYSVPMTVQGEECRVAQVSSVGTLPAYRRRGLNRELTRRAREWVRAHDHRFTYLFADQDAVPFYRACGFQAAPQHRFTASPDPVWPAKHAPVVLDLSDESDRRLVERVARTRTPVSRFLGHRSLGLQMFHMLYTLRECVSYLPEFDLVMATELKGDTLLIHDLVARHLPSFAELQPYLQEPAVARYEFGFVPDLLEVEFQSFVDDCEDGTHVDENFALSGLPFRFPNTSQA